MKLRFSFLLIIFLIALVGCEKGQTPSSAQKPERLSLSFPAVALARNERIVGFKITFTGGGIRSIRNIPPGWDIHLDTALQWKPSLSGSIHHGLEALSELKELQGMVVVQPFAEKQPAFNVEATLLTTLNFQTIQTRSYKMAELVLQPEGS